MQKFMLISRFRHVAALILLAMAAMNAQVRASEPVLEISIGPEARHLSRSDLLANPALQTIDVPEDVAYQRTMRYRALPLSALIPSLPHLESVQFTALDGFAANIPGALFAGEAQPWLAIEPADRHWPALKSGSSAGPFYLVWMSPEKSGVSPEQWPYQIAKIAEAASLEKRYPQIAPHSDAGSAAVRGMHVFIANCSACHRINGGGDAAVGPDLNIPFSPSEYFNDSFLRKLIRDPASVRNWEKRAMPGFSPSVISDAKLDDLLAYLRQMAKQR